MKISLFLICLAAVLWGTSGTTMVLMTQVAPMNPLVVAFWRLAIASPFLLLFATIKNFLIVKSAPSSSLCLPLPPSTSFTSSWQTYLGLGTCMAAYQACYFLAVPLAGVAITALVSICSSPIFITLFAAKFLGEKLNFQVYLSLGLGIVGTSLLVINPQSTTNQGWQFLGGILLALGAGLSYAAYAVGAKATIKKIDPFTILAFSFTAAGLMLSPALVFANSSINNQINNLNTQNWQLQAPFLLYLGIVSTGVAYLIYMQGLKSTNATVAGIAVLLEPLTATCLGILFFRETMGVNSAIGGLLLLGVIAILSFQKS
jgi:drug/metabolite transporter, DME family